MASKQVLLEPQTSETFASKRNRLPKIRMKITNMFLRTKISKLLKVEHNLCSVVRFRCVLVESESTSEPSNLRRRNDVYRRDTPSGTLHFNDGRLATENKSISDILRAFFILKLCRIDTLVDNGEKLVEWCKGLFGTKFYEKIVKATIYQQFVAGESEQDVKLIASNLQKFNIHCMFCVPTEDVSTDNLFMNAHDIENLYETNLNLMLDCIDLTASLGSFAQSKITPVISTEVMHDVADLLTDHRVEHENRPNQLRVETWLNALDGKNQGNLLPGSSSLSNKHLKKALKRLDALANRAQEKGVKLMLDAEYTYIQASIDLIILALQQKYNQHIPVVYNTYQCYRKDTPARIKSDIELARKHNFKIACKLVRGAYMEYERQRAMDYGYEDPICDTIEDTERNYKHAMDLMLSQVAEGQAEVMFATHNEDCVKYGVKRMREIGIQPDDGSVSFAQLYGMCDHVSYALADLTVSKRPGTSYHIEIHFAVVNHLYQWRIQGDAGYIVHKSVPYGTVGSSILYLLRRAQENKSVMARTAKESGILREEMKRRLWTNLGYA